MTKPSNEKICFHCQTSQPLAAYAPSPNSRSPDKLGILCATCRARLSSKEKARLETAFWRAGQADPPKPGLTQNAASPNRNSVL